MSTIPTDLLTALDLEEYKWDYDRTHAHDLDVGRDDQRIATFAQEGWPNWATLWRIPRLERGFALAWGRPATEADRHWLQTVVAPRLDAFFTLHQQTPFPDGGAMRDWWEERALAHVQREYREWLVLRQTQLQLGFRQWDLLRCADALQARKAQRPDG